MRRTQRGAGDALSDLEDPRAADILRNAAETAWTDEHRAMFDAWLKKIADRENPAQPPAQP